MIVYKLENNSRTDWEPYSVPLRCQHGYSFMDVIAPSPEQAFYTGAVALALWHKAHDPHGHCISD